MHYKGWKEVFYFYDSNENLYALRSLTEKVTAKCCLIIPKKVKNADEIINQLEFHGQTKQVLLDLSEDFTHEFIHQVKFFTF